jgi:Ran GTPase-activating protein (RanGAP) involved in mRNA processing and transport
MSVSNNSAGIISDDIALLSSAFLEFCNKVRTDDPSILPEPDQPLRIRRLSEKEDIELADAFLENTNVTYLELGTEKYTKSSAEAMATYIRTSKHLQRIHWPSRTMIPDDQELQHREDMLGCLLPAFQENTSLKVLHVHFSGTAGSSSLALGNMLTHTQSLRYLSLICPLGPLEEVAVAAACSGLKKNTTLRELTLECRGDATAVSSLLTSLRDHSLLRRLCMRGYGVDLTELETLLLSDTSKITELDICRSHGGPMMGLTRVLRALARRPTLSKVELRLCPLDRDDAKLLRLALRNIPSLQSLVLTEGTLGSTGLVELGPALYHNTSIKVLDMSGNSLIDMESAEVIRDILRSNKTMTALDLSRNVFGRTPGAVDCIAGGLGSNSSLLNIDLSLCCLGDDGVSTLARAHGSRNTALQKLTLSTNSITATGVGVLIETSGQNSNYITDLDLRYNQTIGNKGASLLARSLGSKALPNLKRLSLSHCGIGNDGFIALMSALEHNTSLLHLDLRFEHGVNGVSERAYLALAESLPDIKVLQRIDLTWCTGLVSAMPLLLEGLRKNTSLFRFNIASYAPPCVPPTTEETARCAGGWIQEMERLGYRNRFLSLIRAPKESLPPLGVWPHALAREAALPDVVFEVLRSNPSLVPSGSAKGKEVVEDTGVSNKRKPKCGEE